MFGNYCDNFLNRLTHSLRMRHLKVLKGSSWQSAEVDSAEEELQVAKAVCLIGCQYYYTGIQGENTVPNADHWITDNLKPEQLELEEGLIRILLYFLITYCSQ